MEWPEITINTPLSEVQAIHKRIWDYVIENGRKPDTPYMNDCALCEYALVLSCGSTDWLKICSLCPAKDIDPCRPCLNGLYMSYSFIARNTDDDGLRKKLAEEIRDISFREEGYCRMKGDNSNG